MASVLWADFIHQPLFQQTIRDIIEPKIVADRISPLEIRIAELERTVNDLKARQARDARADEADEALNPAALSQVAS